MAHASSRQRLRRALAIRRRLYAANKLAFHSAHDKAMADARMRAAAPWFTLAVTLALLGLGVVITTFINGSRILIDSLVPIGVWLLAASSVPLVIGIVRSIEQPQQRIDHCGRCQFYRAVAGNYQQGACTRDRAKRATTRLDGCEYFTYSERALVHDRLSEVSSSLNTLSET